MHYGLKIDMCQIKLGIFVQVIWSFFELQINWTNCSWKYVRIFKIPKMILNGNIKSTTSTVLGHEPTQPFNLESFQRSLYRAIFVSVSNKV